MAGGLGPRCLAGSGDDALGDEPFEQGSGVHAKEAGDRYSAICHSDLLSGAGAVDPFAELSSEGTDGHIHSASVHLQGIKLYILAT
jgi:hypothetical protein